MKELAQVNIDKKQKEIERAKKVHVNENNDWWTVVTIGEDGLYGFHFAKPNSVQIGDIETMDYLYKRQIIEILN